jgi:hypothetical protein
MQSEEMSHLPEETPSSNVQHYHWWLRREQTCVPPQFINRWTVFMIACAQHRFLSKPW